MKILVDGTEHADAHGSTLNLKGAIGVDADGDGELALSFVSAQPVSTGSIAGLATTDVTLTWDTPFEDASYLVTVSVIDGEAGAGLRVLRIVSKTAEQVVVKVTNDAAAAHTGELHMFAVRA